jgi:hypothetical protein
MEKNFVSPLNEASSYDPLLLFLFKKNFISRSPKSVAPIRKLWRRRRKTRSRHLPPIHTIRKILSDNGDSESKMLKS